MPVPRRCQRFGMRWHGEGFYELNDKLLERMEQHDFVRRDGLIWAMDNVQDSSTILRTTAASMSTWSPTALSTDHHAISISPNFPLVPKEMSSNLGKRRNVQRRTCRANNSEKGISTCEAAFILIPFFGSVSNCSIAVKGRNTKMFGSKQLRCGQCMGDRSCERG